MKTVSYHNYIVCCKRNFKFGFKARLCYQKQIRENFIKLNLSSFPSQTWGKTFQALINLLQAMPFLLFKTCYPIRSMFRKANVALALIFFFVLVFRIYLTEMCGNLSTRFSTSSTTGSCCCSSIFFVLFCTLNFFLLLNINCLSLSTKMHIQQRIFYIFYVTDRLAADSKT